MENKFLNYVLGVLIIISALCIYLFISKNQLQSELTNQILENNKLGYQVKLDSNALLSVGYINQKKMDSLIESGNKKIDSIIKYNKEHPLIVTQWKTNTIIEYVNIPTYPDKDSTYRIAEFQEPKGYYYFKSKYQLVSPFSFTLEKLSLSDSYKLITTKRPDHRIAVYIQNTNPYVHIDSSETLIDPLMVTEYKTEYINSWQWGGFVTTTPFSKNRNTDIGLQLYSPIGLGVTASYSIYNNKEFIPNPSENFKIGIGFLKNF